MKRETETERQRQTHRKRERERTRQTGRGREKERRGGGGGDIQTDRDRQRETERARQRRRQRDTERDREREIERPLSTDNSSFPSGAASYLHCLFRDPRELAGCFSLTLTSGFSGTAHGERAESQQSAQQDPLPATVTQPATGLGPSELLFWFPLTQWEPGFKGSTCSGSRVRGVGGGEAMG